MTPSSIFSFFTGFGLTNDQHAALADLQKFLTTDSRQVFLLKGYAGTGKTTILSGLVKYAKSLEKSVRCTTPTGSASRILSTKTGTEAKTLHSTIYRMVGNSYDEATLTTKVDFVVSEFAPANGTLLIVDEASMIGSGAVSEEGAMSYGSGDLLADLFAFLQLGDNPDTKVLFVGDPAQLPPVGSTHSVTLDGAYLSNAFGLACMEAMLTTVVRYDNAILSTATKIRNAIESNCYGDIRPIEGNEVSVVSSFQLPKAYFRVVNALSDTVHSVALFQANKSVVSFNQKVREHLLGHNGDLQVGERLLVYVNNYLNVPMNNGEFLTVVEVHHRTTRTVSIRTKFAVTPSVFVRPTTTYSADVTLNFLQVSVKNADGYVQRVQILEDFLAFEQPSLPVEVIQALNADLAMRIKKPHMSKSELSQAFSEAAGTDQYYNALRVKFGYAMTCHKAQGGEWRNVFVMSWLPPTMGDENRYRWLYTAYSRAAKRLVVEIPEPTPTYRQQSWRRY